MGSIEIPFNEKIQDKADTSKEKYHGQISDPFAEIVGFIQPVTCKYTERNTHEQHSEFQCGIIRLIPIGKNRCVGSLLDQGYTFAVARHQEDVNNPENAQKSGNRNKYTIHG